MALLCFQSLRMLRSGIRCMSQNAQLVSLTVNDKTGVATLSLQRPPVNSLNLELLTEISSALTEATDNNSRGLILTSTNDGVFSAGLDILEMYKPNLDRVKEFWTKLQETWIKLYQTAYPTVAVINGHSPAGGCLLALSCEHRIMVKNFTIGLNETRLGIVAPPWFIASMVNVIGQRQSERALTLGHMFTTEEAKNVGLIDEIVQNKAEGTTQAEAFIQKFAKIPFQARSLTKTWLRNKTVESLVKNREDDLNMFLQVVTQPNAQESLGHYIQSLKNKATK
ncbi:unnamed protein product [Phaedon cochleariae]|uniref:Enoyl-CoA delta isomerase 1, mitochondrial n=1 Tax=Phaedon cochleariae TaxID=80249 RepID=A0A9P0DTC0_PHACE|nr:unnamed protein product [Phaedon cochleariae]